MTYSMVPARRVRTTVRLRSVAPFVLCLVVCMMLVGAPATAQPVDGEKSLPEVELPDPPDGFGWERLDAIKGAFLLPDGWHVKAEQQEGSHAYFLTREDINAEGQFVTGLSINIVYDVEDKTGYAAPTYAQAFAPVTATAAEADVLERARIGDEVLSGVAVRMRSTNEAGKSIVMHQVTLGNANTQTLYIIMFESPEAEWDEAWAKGSIMLDRFVLDRGV